jgi:hypothetical protein
MQRAIFGFVFLSLSGIGLVHDEKAGSGDVIKELRRIEEEEASIWVSRPGDPAALAKANRILGDDYVCLCDGGEVTKQQSIEEFKSGASRIKYLRLGEMKVRVFGDTAVVTGSDDRKGSYKGQEYSGHYVWTDVLAKRHGQWQEVVAHSCKQ